MNINKQTYKQDRNKKKTGKCIKILVCIEKYYCCILKRKAQKLTVFKRWSRIVANPFISVLVSSWSSLPASL